MWLWQLLHLYMKLLGTYRDKDNVLGFTLIEIVLVMALMFLVGVPSYFIGVSFYQTQVLNETSQGLLSSLRQAQLYASTDNHDSAFGVYIEEGSYIFFEGNSYISRVESEDVVAVIPASVTITAPDEIIFSRLEGSPSYVGEIVMNLGTKERKLIILPSGNIDR